MIKQLRRFARDETASLTVEVVLMTPILLWGYVGLFILFDGYRALSSNIRTAYTISDMLSRQTVAIDADFIEGLNSIQDILTQSSEATVLRVTVASYDINDDEHNLEWSYSTQGQQAVTESTFALEIENYLPPMGHGEQLVVVETWMAYAPFVSPDVRHNYCGARDFSAEMEAKIGDTCDKGSIFGPFVFEGRVVTRPRFSGQMLWDDGSA